MAVRPGEERTMDEPRPLRLRNRPGQTILGCNGPDRSQGDTIRPRGTDGSGGRTEPGWQAPPQLLHRPPDLVLSLTETARAMGVRSTVPFYFPALLFGRVSRSRFERVLSPGPAVTHLPGLVAHDAAQFVTGGNQDPSAVGEESSPMPQKWRRSSLLTRSLVHRGRETPLAGDSPAEFSTSN